MAIKQCEELWPTATDTRTRVWWASVSGPGTPVLVRRVAVLAPGEDLTEYPETWLLSWDEWVASHESVYGLTREGQPLAEAVAARAAWRKLRRAAAGTDPVDAAYATAVLRILRGIAREVAD